MPSADVFTFITVYYKHGEYYSKKFPTLRQGLQEFLQDYVNGTSHEDGIHRQQLEALPDEELLTEIFKLGERNLTCFIFRASFYTIHFFSAGCEQIDEQRGSGLVAVVKALGSRHNPALVSTLRYTTNTESGTLAKGGRPTSTTRWISLNARWRKTGCFKIGRICPRRIRKTWRWKGVKRMSTNSGDGGQF